MRTIGVSLFFFALLALSAPRAEAQSLAGVWRGTEVEVLNGPDAGVTVLEHPRLLIYTDAYFMWAFEAEGGPRPLGDSDAEISEAAQRYMSTAGMYVRDGADIRYSARIALNPNAMLPENQDFVRQIRTLTANVLETQATNDEGVTTVLRYERVE